MSHEHSLDHCCALVTQLNEFIDGELPDELCRELKGHLADCPDCKVVLDTLSQTVRILHQLDDAPQPLPAELEARLLARLNLGAR